jgi:hypothetical protein
MIKLSNNAFGTLSGAILSGATSIVLTAGHGARFPALGGQDYFYATLVDTSGNLEIVKVTARATDTLTVVRGQDGTTARAYSSGDRLELRPCNATLLALQQESPLAYASSGTDTYTATLAPVPTAYNTGQVYAVTFGATNTSTAPTLNLNSLGAKTIKKYGSAALLAGDIQSGVTHWLEYNGTDLILLNPAKGQLRGKQTMWIPAGAMIARSTNPATFAQTELATNKIMLNTLDFADGAVRYAQFGVAMPKGWDAGTITAKFHWTKSTGTGDIVWQIQALALGDNEAIDAAPGTAVTVTDTCLTDNFEHVTADTSAMTVGSSPAARNRVVFQVFRDNTHVSDTSTATAKLIGVELTFNLSAADDS